MLEQDSACPPAHGLRTFAPFSDGATVPAASTRWTGAVFVQTSPRWKRTQKRQVLRLARL